MSKLRNFLDFVSSSCKSCEDSSDVCSWLHRDDSELIFFVDPNKEGLVVIVEDSTSLWPVSVEIAGLKEPISLLEKEVILDQLISLLVSH